MNKKDKIEQILFQIKQQIDEILDEESTQDMSAEEIVILSTEIITGSPVTTIEYSSPIGMVDVGKVAFSLDDDWQFPLFGEEYYEED